MTWPRPNGWPAPTHADCSILQRREADENFVCLRAIAVIAYGTCLKISEAVELLRSQSYLRMASLRTPNFIERGTMLNRCFIVRIVLVFGQDVITLLVLPMPPLSNTLTMLLGMLPTNRG